VTHFVKAPKFLEQCSHGDGAMSPTQNPKAASILDLGVRFRLHDLFHSTARWGVIWERFVIATVGFVGSLMEARARF
jgi:hypothetical protein